MFTNRTIGMMCFSTGTNGPLELPCTQLDHMKNEMHIHQRNHWNDMLSIGTNRTIGTNGPSESLCMQQNHMENNLSPRNEMHINQ